MKFTIDIDKLTWVEVPGKPTVGSFLACMEQAHWGGKFGKEDRPKAAAMPRLHQHLLVKYESCAYTSTDTGYTVGEPTAAVELIDAFRDFKGPFPRFSAYGPERILAYCNDLGVLIGGAEVAAFEPDRPFTTPSPSPAVTVEPAPQS